MKSEDLNFAARLHGRAALRHRAVRVLHAPVSAGRAAAVAGSGLRGHLDDLLAGGARPTVVHCRRSPDASSSRSLRCRREQALTFSASRVTDPHGVRRDGGEIAWQFGFSIAERSRHHHDTTSVRPAGDRPAIRSNTTPAWARPSRYQLEPRGQLSQAQRGT